LDNILVNKTITGIKIASDKKAILFEVEGGEHIAKCDGDCCSSTWVENIELPTLGFPAKVISAEDIDMSEPAEKDEDMEVVAYYGLKIQTDKGDIVIDYRNESNGYYGGSLCWENENYYYGGVFSQNISTFEWEDVK